MTGRLQRAETIMTSCKCTSWRSQMLVPAVATRICVPGSFWRYKGRELQALFLFAWSAPETEARLWGVSGAGFSRPATK